MNVSKLLGKIGFKSIGGKANRLSKTDFGILKVAFMVAALDGEITEAEYKAFELLAKNCRGYSVKSAAAALDEAMRSAGYLMLFSQRNNEKDLVKAFMAEARAALPNGFAYLSIEEIRRAIVTWIVMGLSDGDYSVRERNCIESLRKFFAELKALRIQQEEEQWLSLSTDLRQACASMNVQPQATVELVSKDFVGQVERLVQQYGDKAEAMKMLDSLIKGK